MNKRKLERITKIQEELFEKFRNTPKDGVKVKYGDKEFIILKNVFWSEMRDSTPLIKNYKINPGEEVLDVCTGSGVIAIFSAYKGAKKVVATDINPNAIKCAKLNAKLHGFSKIIDVRLCDLFDGLKKKERFDVITGDLPFRDKKAKEVIEFSMWDTNLDVHKKFFKEINKWLKPNGRVYLAQANFGAVKEMKKMAKKAGFKIKLIGKNRMQETPFVFYGFELRRK